MLWVINCAIEEVPLTCNTCASEVCDITECDVRPEEGEDNVEIENNRVIKFCDHENHVTVDDGNNTVEEHISNCE